MLSEQPYSSITIRQLSSVAGTGIGTFYDYFSNKDDLARWCVKERTDHLVAQVRSASESIEEKKCGDIIKIIASSYVSAHSGKVKAWTSHYLLERILSQQIHYNNMSRIFFDAWELGIRKSTDIDKISLKNIYNLSRHCQIISYGMISYSFLNDDKKYGVNDLLESIINILHPYAHSLQEK